MFDFVGGPSAVGQVLALVGLVLPIMIVPAQLARKQTIQVPTQVEN